MHGAALYRTHIDYRQKCVHHSRIAHTQNHSARKSINTVLWFLNEIAQKLKSASIYFLITRSHSFTTSKDTLPGRIISQTQLLSLMQSYECDVCCATLSDLERAEIWEKYNNPKRKELIKMSCYTSNSHMGSSTVSYAIAVHKVFQSQLQTCFSINDVISDQSTSTFIT